MRLLSRRTAAAFAAVYLTASLLASALHSHAGHAACGDAACAAHPAAHAHAGCTHHHAVGTAEQPAPPQPVPTQQTGCVVCEFLAQPPLPVAVVRLTDELGPSVPLPRPVVLTLVSAAPPALTARGPPVV